MKSKNDISVCQGNTCVKASGVYADSIAIATFFAIGCIGVAALVKALN